MSPNHEKAQKKGTIAGKIKEINKLHLQRQYLEQEHEQDGKLDGVGNIYNSVASGSSCQN